MTWYDARRCCLSCVATLHKLWQDCALFYREKVIRSADIWHTCSSYWVFFIKFLPFRNRFWPRERNPMKKLYTLRRMALLNNLFFDIWLATTPWVFSVKRCQIHHSIEKLVSIWRSYVFFSFQISFWITKIKLNITWKKFFFLQNIFFKFFEIEIRKKDPLVWSTSTAASNDIFAIFPWWMLPKI